MFSKYWNISGTGQAVTIMFGVNLSGFILLLLIIISGNTNAHSILFHCHMSEGNSDLSTWHHNYSERCYFLDGNNPKNENTDTIENILYEMRKEPFLADYLLDNAKQLNTAFCIEDRADGCRGYFDYGFNVIAVRHKLDLFTKVIIYIHELRHVDQLTRGFQRSLDYDADEMARLTFAIEADVNAFLALYAWRLKKNGFPQVWQKLFKLTRYFDIYEVFKTEIQASGNELKASKLAFVQWYKSKWRTTGYYRNSIGGYYDLLDDTKLIQKYYKLPEDYFDDLCILPNGLNYGCHLTDEIKSLKK